MFFAFLLFPFSRTPGAFKSGAIAFCNHILVSYTCLCHLAYKYLSFSHMPTHFHTPYIILPLIFILFHPFSHLFPSSFIHSAASFHPLLIPSTTLSCMCMFCYIIIPLISILICVSFHLFPSSSTHLPTYFHPSLLILLLFSVYLSRIFAYFHAPLFILHTFSSSFTLILSLISRILCSFSHNFHPSGLICPLISTCYRY